MERFVFVRSYMANANIDEFCLHGQRLYFGGGCFLVTHRAGHDGDWFLLPYDRDHRGEWAAPDCGRCSLAARPV